MDNFFEIKKRGQEKNKEALLMRAGILHTKNGDILTPAFVPVGTKATLKGLTPEMLKDLGAEVVLANTYHLLLQPGDEIVRDAGGLHRFMNWQGPILTDSGGFQVFSLGVAYGKGISKVLHPNDISEQIPERSSADDGVPRLATIGNDGVSFRSHIDGGLHYITPEKSIEIQHNLGADIIFAFDECTSPTEDRRYQEEALSRTHAWAKRCLEKHADLCISKDLILKSEEGVGKGDSLGNTNPFIFGVVQGGRDEDLRRKSAKFLSELEFVRTDESRTGFDGFGIGGSFDKDDLHSAVRWVNEELPENKPRHLLGIGEPEDIFLGVENGVDLFDCVAPTRNARNGTLYTKNGKINMMNAQFVKDFSRIEEGCGCYTCTGVRSLTSRNDEGTGRSETSGSYYTKAYISHLFRAKEMLAGTLATIHNLYFIVNLVKNIRQSILDDNFFEFKEEFLKNYKEKNYKK